MNKERQNQDTTKNKNRVPGYLKRWPGLTIRKGDRIINAPEDDVKVAKNYLKWREKGQVIDGKRLTILTQKTTYNVNDEVRVIHVVEVPEPGHDVYIMGPKKVYSEYIDDLLATEHPPKWEIDPFEPSFYDGAVLESPAVDYNYEITTYSFSKPGMHKIYWKLGDRQSNIITLKIIDK